MGERIDRAKPCDFFRDRKETPRLDMLRQLFLFATLSRVELRVVNGMLHERRYLKGEIIFDEGEEGQTVYMVIAGRVLPLERP